MTNKANMDYHDIEADWYGRTRFANKNRIFTFLLTCVVLPFIVAYKVIKQPIASILGAVMMFVVLLLPGKWFRSTTRWFAVKCLKKLNKQQAEVSGIIRGLHE